MKVLGIDTATAVASVALVEDGKLVLEAVQSNGNQEAAVGARVERPNHAVAILPLLDGLLKRAGKSMDELSALAVSIGPGSFTGLRIGLSTVKGLAYGWSVPVVGVPTLDAVAERVMGWEGLVCPFLDARRKEVYAAVFRRKATVLERLSEDLVDSPGKVIDRIRSCDPSSPCLFIGDGTSVYGDLIEGVLGGRASLTLGEGFPSIASAVARLGEQGLKRSDFDTVGPLVPLYLRPSEAELKRGCPGDKL